MRLVPFGPHSLYLRPFKPDGMTPGGVFIPGHHDKLPAIYGRVTATHPTCSRVRVGDWIIFRRDRPVRTVWSGGVTYATTEEQVLAVLEPGDGAPWWPSGET